MRPLSDGFRLLADPTRIKILWQATEDSPWSSAQRILMRVGSASSRKPSLASSTFSSVGISKSFIPSCIRRYDVVVSDVHG